MLPILSLGFLTGMGHAFEADHVAAVSSLISGRRKPGDMALQGALWGMGHTLTLLIAGGSVMLAGRAIGPVWASRFEAMVGVMLVLLGAHVLWRLWRERAHFHVHTHEDGTRHLHLHSHRGERGAHDPAHHTHAHPDARSWRALLVGMMHGLAGSAALVLTVAAAQTSAAMGLAYIVLFGVGSILGMTVMSLAMAVPLVATARWMTRANGALQLAIGAITIAIGVTTLLATVPEALG